MAGEAGSKAVAAFIEHTDPSRASAIPLLSTAPWRAEHGSGYALYYPTGFARAELTLRHHLLGIELLPNIVGLTLDGGPRVDTVVPAASFYFVPAGTRVTIDKAYACEYLLLTFAPEASELPAGVATGMREQLRGPAFAAAAHMVRSQLLYEGATPAALTQLVSAARDALTHSERTPRPARPEPVPQAADPRLGRALAHVGTRFMDKLSVSDLATAAGATSPVRFAHVFSAAFAMSAHRYILDYRVHAARSRLVHSVEPIADIAHESGFCSQAHMTETFRRRLGISPAHVRRGALARTAS